VSWCGRTRRGSGRGDFGAEDLAAELHAVTDAEDGQAEAEDFLVAAGGAGS